MEHLQTEIAALYELLKQVDIPSESQDRLSNLKQTFDEQHQKLVDEISQQEEATADIVAIIETDEQTLKELYDAIAARDTACVDRMRHAFDCVASLYPSFIVHCYHY